MLETLFELYVFTELVTAITFIDNDNDNLKMKT